MPTSFKREEVSTQMIELITYDSSVPTVHSAQFNFCRYTLCFGKSAGLFIERNAGTFQFPIPIQDSYCAILIPLSGT